MHSPVGLQGRPPWASVGAGRFLVSPPRPTPPAYAHLRDYFTRLIFQVLILWETAAATGAVGLPTRVASAEGRRGAPPMVGLSAAGDGRSLRASIQPVERIPCLRRASECWRDIPLSRKARHFSGGGTGRDAETSASLFAEKRKRKSPPLNILLSSYSSFLIREVPFCHFQKCQFGT